MSAVFGEAVYSALSADGTVSGLVGTRIYPNVMPEGSDLPAVVYSVISDVPENSFTGAYADRLRGARVQVDCYARPSTAGGAYRQAETLAEAVDACLTSQLTCWREVSRDLYDDVTQYHRVSIDFAVWR